MNLIKNENADVYTWLMLCVMVIVIMGIYLISIQVVDPLVDKHDELSGQDRMTEQNVECFNFNINVFKAFPVIIIFGLAFWAIITTIRTRGD